MTTHSARVVLIPIEAQARRAVVLVLTLVAAATIAAAIIRPVVAMYLADRATTVGALERALAWDPRDPDLHLRLGRAYVSLAERPDYERARRHLETALGLRPTDAYARMDLARLLDRQGDRDHAREALDAALRADPHSVTIRWQAALLAFGWGDRERALEHFRYVLAVDPSQQDAAFQLARILLGPAEDPGDLLPKEAQGLTNVLAAAMRHRDLALAEAAWTRRASLAPPLPLVVPPRPPAAAPPVPAPPVPVAPVPPPPAPPVPVPPPLPLVPPVEISELLFPPHAAPPQSSASRAALGSQVRERAGGIDSG